MAKDQQVFKGSGLIAATMWSLMLPDRRLRAEVKTSRMVLTCRVPAIDPEGFARIVALSVVSLNVHPPALLLC